MAAWIDEKVQANVGTEGHKAPEVEVQEVRHKRSDIFSLGITMFSLYTNSATGGSL